MRAESACVRRNKRSFGDQQCARRGRTLRVIRDCDVSMNTLVIRAAARERRQDDTVGEGKLADFDWPEKHRSRLSHLGCWNDVIESYRLRGNCGKERDVWMKQGCETRHIYSGSSV